MEDHNLKETIINHINLKTYYENELPFIRWNGNGQGMSLCPFHDDKHPSLSLNNMTGEHHCLGCGQSGSVFDFHMKKHGLSFKESLDDLARFAGIDTTQGLERKIVATYDYTDSQGNLIFQTVRYEPKDFRQRRPDGKGEWVYNLQGVNTVPYRLQTVIEPSDVLIVEGEKDVETLRGLGFVATCNPMGAGKWKPVYNPYFTEKNIVILPDNDDAGRKHALSIARNLRGIVKSLKVIELPGLPEKGDITDWIGLTHSKQELLDLIIGTSGWEDQNDETGKDQEGKLIFTRLGVLLKEPDENIEWTIEGLLPSAGFSLLGGKPKGGKSTLARNLALSIARGSYFLNRKTQKGPVLYLALEEKRYEVRKHFSDMGADGTEEIHVFASSAPVDALTQLKATVQEIKPVLVIIDPLFRLTRVRDGNDYVQVTAALEPLLRLARDSGAHVMVVHHTGKRERTGGDSILGSTAILGSVDTAILLKRGDKYRTIHTIQRYGQDLEETTLSFDPGTRIISLGETKEKEDLKGVEDVIYEYLSGQTESFTEAEILEAIEGRKSLKVKAIRSLLEKQQIRREGKGGKGDPFKYSCSLVPTIYTGTTKQENELTHKPLRDNDYSGSQPVENTENLQEQEKNDFVLELQDSSKLKKGQMRYTESLRGDPTGENRPSNPEDKTIRQDRLF